MSSIETPTPKNKKSRLLKSLIPILLGITIGLGCYVMYISKATSYLSDDPKACVNCHIMAPEYATWFHSSHGRNTTCNDCHVPHDNVVRKYYFKAMDGMRHASMFALNMEPQTIKILSPGQKVVQENCIRCHSTLNEVVKTAAVTAPMAHEGNGKLCWDCHRDVPHGNVRGLSSAPNARVPLADSPIPSWLQKLNDKKETENTQKESTEH